MSKFQNQFRIESSRLKDFDYSTPWWYYVTINTKHHNSFFGTIEKGKMIINELGNIVDYCWNVISNHYTYVELDYYIIMPNHMHGIIIINERVETRHASSLRHMNVTLSDIVGSFKSAVTKAAKEKGYTDFSWQTRFYDRIIRNEKELFNIRKYIEQNPLRWDLDKDKPENICDL